MARAARGLAGTGLSVAAAALALLAAGAPAMVASAATDPPPPVEGSGVVAAVTAPTTVTSKYSCDLSGYAASVPAATLSATVTIPASVAADSQLHLTLATTASDALPAAVLTALKGVTSFDVSAELSQQPGVANTVSGVSVAGTAQAPATLTAVPAATATGSAEFTSPGSGVIMAPAPTLTITPLIGAKALTAITCTTTDAVKNVKVTVTPQVIGTSGPVYACVLSVAGVAAETVDAHIPGTVTASGARTTGTTDTVTYSTGAFGPWTTGSTSVRVVVDVATSLSVTGAQPGQISISQPIDPTSAVLTVSGKLPLTKAGTDRILVPRKLAITIKETAGAVTITGTFTCTLTTTPAPVGLTMAVTKAAGTTLGSGTPTPTTTPAPASTQTGVPVGAPDTGGGTGSGVGIGAVAAGGAIAVSGGGLILASRRRRN